MAGSFLSRQTSRRYVTTAVDNPGSLKNPQITTRRRAATGSALIALALAACKGTDAPPPPPIDVSGNWEYSGGLSGGGLQCVLNSNAAVIFWIKQTGDQVQGKHQQIGIDCLDATSGDLVEALLPHGDIISGTVKGSSVSFDFSTSNWHNSAEFLPADGGQLLMNGSASARIDFGPPRGVVSLSGPFSAIGTRGLPPPEPTIALTPSGVSFSATQGGTNPAPQTVSVTNGGGGTLSGLAVGTIAYGAGQPTGWLGASLSGSTAPVTLTLTVTTGSLPAGSYTATMPVTSTGASNSPQTVSLTLVVGPPAPAIALTPSSVSFSATQGGTNPAPQTVSVTNGGGGTLSGLAVGTIAYGAGQPTGWLGASLSGSTAPVTLTLTVTTGSLPAGSYTATMPVTSTGASNSPQTVSLTLVVGPPAPAIALTPSSVSFSATQGGTNPAPQTVSVTNGGGGTLSGLAVGTIAYSAGQPTGWLSAGLSSSTAPATLTLTVTTGSLVAGSYTATVPVISSVASNSPQTVSVTFVVSPPAPAIALTPSSVSFSATQAGANPAPQTVSVTNSGGGTLSGLVRGTISYGAGQPTGWLAAVLDQPDAPTTLTLSATTGSLAAGTYTATVPVIS